MGRVLSTIVAVALLLGLGALAVLALPGTGAPMTASPVAAAPLAAEPDAPAAPGAQNYNVIALPLKSQNQFASAGFTYDADGLADLVGPGVLQVLRWDALNQFYEFWLPLDQDGVNFSLELAGTYWLLLDNTSANIVSFVGGVPDQDSIQYNLVGDTVSCKYNDISIPLDQSGIANADELASAIGNVAQVLHWDAQNQQFEFWLPADQDGVNFQVKIGYPYTVCMNQNTTWPQ